MKRSVYLLFLVCMLVLAACSGSPTATATTAPTNTVQPTSTGGTTIQTTTPIQLGKLGDITPCNVVGMLPDPVPGLPPVTDADWTLGNRSARLTILEYSDFQCPGCAAIAPVLSQLVAKYPNDILFVYRHFPLTIHNLALLSAQAAEAAGLQGKFWEMHEILFANQGTWSVMTPADAESWFTDQAAALGLDKAKFVTDMKSEAIVAKAAKAQTDGATMGLGGTPTVYINGLPYNFQYIPTLDQFSGVVDQVLGVMALEPRAYKACPPVVIDQAKQYVATLKTTKGDIVINLYADKAPLTVNSFVFLARAGWFNNVPFHRVLDGFVAQAGDPSGTGMGSPGYEYANEIAAGLSYDKPGVVGMANAGADTNGSQFFITLAAATNLDGGYTIFGQVTEASMAVVNNLTKRDPSSSDTLPDPDLILSVMIEEK